MNLMQLVEKEGQAIEGEYIPASVPPMYPHQEFSVEFYLNTLTRTPRPQEGLGVLNLSKCGTGKTRGVIEFLRAARKRGYKGKIMVLAPLTILESAWGEDIEKYTPELTYSVCYAKGREESLSKDVDIYLINHDAVRFLQKNQHLLKYFAGGILVIDEITAYKSPDSKRSHGALWLRQYFLFCIGMSGTLGSQLLSDYFYPCFIIDGGYRLGKQFTRFQNDYMMQVFTKDSKQKKFKEIEGARDTVFDIIRDMSIRFDKDMAPLNTKRHMYVKLPPAVMKEYRRLVSMDLLIGENGEAITAVNAGVKLGKILQLCSGNVYDANKKVVGFHEERIELAIDLALEANQALIAFNFTHERDALLAAFRKRGVTEVAYIDGTVPISKRAGIVADFQAGRIKWCVLHPKSCAHGLTFTAGERTIWVSPCTSREYFIQFNHRIDRAGQKNETETITICAKGTKESAFYDGMFAGIENMYELLALFAEETQEKMKKVVAS